MRPDPGVSERSDRPYRDQRREMMTTFIYGTLIVFAIVAFIMLAIGLGFEAVKWLGNTQK